MIFFINIANKILYFGVGKYLLNTLLMCWVIVLKLRDDNKLTNKHRIIL